MSTQAPISPSTEVPRRRSDDMLATLADRLGAQFTASTVFGAPVERGGVTVIPVATVRLGFGGGSGTDPNKGKGAEGTGGGGGGMAAPAGYIEMRGDRTRFVPVVHPARMTVLVAGTILAALAILRPQISTPPVARLLRR
jgi:uncharacterized spore protein YtfJ